MNKSKSRTVKEPEHRTGVSPFRFLTSWMAGFSTIRILSSSNFQQSWPTQPASAHTHAKVSLPTLAASATKLGRLIFDFLGRPQDRRVLFILLSAMVLWTWGADVAWAADEAAPAAKELGVRELFRAGGVIGIVILALSVAMLALIVEHLLSIRRSALLPPGLGEEVREQIAAGQFKQAEQHCRDQPSLLGHILASGLAEVGLGYSAIEKSMEDAAVEQSARLHRKIEYLSVIGTIAPMLGLLGTVWGMIQAFLEFESKANPQVSELAPGIYKALVTTLLGLGVAVPALASFAIFRNRIDELVAESALTAEQVFSDLKRSLVARRQKSRSTTAARGRPAPDDASFLPAEPEKTG